MRTTLTVTASCLLFVGAQWGPDLADVLPATTLIAQVVTCQLQQMVMVMRIMARPYGVNRMCPVTSRIILVKFRASDSFFFFRSFNFVLHVQSQLCERSS